jgi:hypothetical protein
MSETERPKNIGRSIAAVLAGFVAVVILSVGTDILLHAAGVFPPLGQPMSDALLLLATVYRTVFAIAGCYLTARLAPDRPMRHATVGGVIGLVLSTVGAVVTWNRGTGVRPPLVSPRAYRHRIALRLAGRQTPRDAIARAAGVIVGLLLMRLRVSELPRFILWS